MEVGRMIKINLPKKVNTILHTLMKHGFEAYAVGGCVRDSVLSRIPMDWDITTSAKPEQIKKIFPHTIDTGIRHGTVTVMLEGESFEVTAYRIDGTYSDGRHPDKVQFTTNLLEDLKRRDFTINAMAYNDKAGLVDAFDGIGDLHRGMIRCVGCARERFSEDALRMLRAVRFASQLGFAIEEETSNAIVALAPNLSKVSAERIQTELVKLLVSAHPEQLLLASKLGLTKVFLPEFDVMLRTRQQNVHHCYTVGEHTLEALKNIAPDKALRLTMLLHDVAKPECRTTDEAGIDHFYGHPVKGSEKAKKILRRLKFDNDTISIVAQLVYWHDSMPELTEKGVRKAICKVGTKLYPALFEVKRADILAQSRWNREEKLENLKEYERIYQRILEKGQCLSVKELAVTGTDLIAAGMKPGREIGEELKRLLQLVLEEPEKNTKEQLMNELNLPHI